jgi:ATP-dependent protease HslVU (ClpYQ) peptidase subunit
MTIIVASASERVMVSDTQVTGPDDRTISYHAAKIVRCKDGALAGAAGGNVPCLNFLKWAQDGRKGPKPPSIKQVTGIVLTKKGEVLVYDGSHIADPALGGFAAIGSGAPVAQGAHHAGARAVQCVEAAIAWSTHCGGRAVIEKL